MSTVQMIANYISSYFPRRTRRKPPRTPMHYIGQKVLLSGQLTIYRACRADTHEVIGRYTDPHAARRGAQEADDRFYAAFAARVRQ